MFFWGGPNSDLSVAEICNFAPGDFRNAKAVIKVDQPRNGPNVGTTSVEIKIKDAIPDILFTVWYLFFPTFGPISTDPVTPLVDTKKVVGPVWSTPSEALVGGVLQGKGLGDTFSRTTGLPDSGEAGDPFPANGFWTDENGDAEYKVKLNFGVFRDPDSDNGYPFGEIEDELTARFGALTNPGSLVTVPVTGTPFVPRISIVSHCWDNVGHALVSGTDERWFFIAGDPR